MPPKAHAILSASSSHRWLHCPPSARLCETYEDKGSDYAAEGTDAHSLCEYKLRMALGMEATDPTEHLTWYNEEMLDCANGYASYILELVEAAKETGKIVTAEEHSVIGGLGSAVAEALVKNSPVPVEMVGVQDQFGEVGPVDYLAERFELKAENIAATVEKVLVRK